MNGSTVLESYAIASNGNAEAYQWLCAWHGWCHAIDDHVDEGRPARDVIELCARGAVIFSAPFYRRHAEALGPLVGIIAAQYEKSLEVNGVLADALRIAGNQMVLAVAYLTGGTESVRRTSDALWPVVEATQLQPNP